MTCTDTIDAGFCLKTDILACDDRLAHFQQALRHPQFSTGDERGRPCGSHYAGGTRLSSPFFHDG